MAQRGRGAPAGVLALALLSTAFVMLLPSAPQAGADTPSPGQLNGCYSHLTSNWSTFAFPISGTAAAGSGGTVTLSNTAVTFPLSGSLAVAGEGAGVLSASPDAAHFDLPGTDAVNSTSFTNLGLNTATGNGQMTIAGSNTTEGTQRLTSNPINTSFALIGTSPSITVYLVTGTLTPGTLNGLTAASGNNLPVAITFPNSTWHPTGSSPVIFTESTTPAPTSNTTPSTTTTSSPLFIGAHLGIVASNFYCWPGESNGTPDPTTGLPGAGSSLVPAGSSAPNTVVTIATYGAGGGSTTTTAGGSTTTTTGGSTTTTTGESTTTAPAETSTTAGTTATTAASTATTAGASTTSASGGVNNGSRTYAASCTNSLAPTAAPTPLNFTVAGTVPAQVTAASPVTLTNDTWTVAVPGSLLDLGIAAGVLNPGDTVQATLTAAISGTNTAQGTVTAAPVTVTFGPITVDANGNAASTNAKFSVPPLTWTAVGGTVGLSMAKSTIKVTIKVINVTFTCDPGAAAAFVSTAVVGQSGIPAASVSGAQVLGTSVSRTPSALAFTGSPRDLARLLILALILLDLGYLSWSTTRHPRRRRARA